VIAEKLRLNLGARNRPIEGFRGMDIDSHPGIDFVGDVSDLSRFKDGEVSEIYASHILEHFPHPKTAGVLKEWSRVLEKGGTLYVAVPDFARAVEIYHKCNGVNQWLQDWVSGGQEYPTAYHYAIFDWPKLANLLLDAGFSRVRPVDNFPIGDKGDCSRLVSTTDKLPLSLNVVAIK
jgi:predicted SAM-dependent methyltransferase